MKNLFKVFLPTVIIGLSAIIASHSGTIEVAGKMHTSGHAEFDTR